MTKKQTLNLHKKIEAGIKAAIAQLYRDAKKYKWELVISVNGKVKKIKPWISTK